MKLRATIVLEYDADPADYGTSDPVEMVKMDMGTDLVALVATADSCEVTVVAGEPNDTGESEHE